VFNLFRREDQLALEGAAAEIANEF
jgi:hypothetical protein